MMCLTVLLQGFTQHERELLLILSVGQELLLLHCDRQVSCECHSIVPAFRFDRLWCVMSLVLVFLYPSKTIMASPYFLVTYSVYWMPLSGISAGTLSLQRFQIASARAGLSASRSKREESNRAAG